MFKKLLASNRKIFTRNIVISILLINLSSCQVLNPILNPYFWWGEVNYICASRKKPGSWCNIQYCNVFEDGPINKNNDVDESYCKNDLCYKNDYESIYACQGFLYFAYQPYLQYTYKNGNATAETEIVWKPCNDYTSDKWMDLPDYL